MIKRLLPLACLPLVLLGGCAIHQTVHPLDAFADNQVCIINNPQVRPAVMASYRHVLADKGYTVRELPESAAITECKVTSTYRANWRWDLAMYMHYAEFRVFVDGKEKGVAIYDATRGGGNLGKFIDADKKIAELINQLFPGGAGTHAASTN
ncbi:MAG: Sbal_3080 family lipoprotein [Betaproteobacteria bacterium]